MIIKLASVGALSFAVFSTIAFYGPQEVEAQSGMRRGKQTHYEALWGWLKRSNYTKWNGADGTAPDFQEGESPHGALIKTYVSGKAATDLKNLPYGSVVVKENYSPDKKLMAVTAMHRSAKFDPKNGDWYYAKYMPDGTIAKAPPEMNSVPIAGRVNMCIECHSSADGNDFAFFND